MGSPEVIRYRKGLPVLKDLLAVIDRHGLKINALCGTYQNLRTISYSRDRQNEIARKVVEELKSKGVEFERFTEADASLCLNGVMRFSRLGGKQ